jgi:uncharacterized metal-binding protein YceD (DUF177 family)
VRIVVADIQSSARRLQAGLSDAWAVRAVEVALEAAPTALAVDLLFQERGGVVFVTGEAKVETSRICDRCGQTMALALSGDVDLKYVPTESRDSGEVELAAGDLDIGWFADGVIDAGDVLSEAIALALPSRVVCTEVEACEARIEALLGGGQAPTGHPGLAALKDLAR